MDLLPNGGLRLTADEAHGAYNLYQATDRWLAPDDLRETMQALGFTLLNAEHDNGPAELDAVLVPALRHIISVGKGLGRSATELSNQLPKTD